MSKSKRNKFPSSAPTNGADGTNGGGPLPAFDDEVRRTAYELYLARNAEDGDAVSDWVEAERLVRARARDR